MKSKNGFTLIELLVVLAIVTILVALLFPVLVSARERAQATRCQSNLQQIGKALDSYTQDWDDGLPPSMDVEIVSKALSWKDLLLPYLESREVFLCPTNPVGWGSVADYLKLRDAGPNHLPYAPEGKLGFPFAPGDGTGRFPVSYGVNLYLFRAGPDFLPNGQPNDFNALLHLSDFPDPSRTLTVGETRHRSFVTAWDFAGLGHHHQKRIQYLFMDGHVKSLKAIQTLLPQSLWGPRERVMDWGTIMISEQVALQNLPVDPMSPEHPLIASIAVEYR